MSAGMIALNRFGLGARPGEIDRIPDPRQWLLDQIGDAPPGLVGEAPDPTEARDALSAIRTARASRDQEQIRAAMARLGQIRTRDVSRVLLARIVSDRPFMERWVAFWANHLCVSPRSEPIITALVGAYEREAIRPNVLGGYADLLLASARHPAMLLYLDNQNSAGPNSTAVRRGSGRRRPRMARTGLNENYARELLELHTVGVNGGYDQDDVQQLARIFTGWSIAGLLNDDQPLGFNFIDMFHEPGAKTVLGRRYEEAGEREGVRAMHDLARLPQTARFVSTKIARHFISDDPPASAIDGLAQVWMSTQGDLRSVAAALVQLDEAWEEGHRKFRTPQDWIVAIFRITGETRIERRVELALRQLRHEVWAPPAPTGYSDTTGDWADPDSLMNRAEVSRTYADRGLRGRALDPRDLMQVIDIADSDPLAGLLSDRTISVADRLALGFASPAFQWR